jgi:hypothetical protein
MQRIEMLRNDSKMFFFNLKFLKDTKELHIGDGSDTDHFNLCFCNTNSNMELECCARFLL